MTTVNNIAELGFTSWQELYEWLRSQGLQDHEEVELTWPDAPGEVLDDIDAPAEAEALVREDVKLATDYIKARAFEEMYEDLPTRKSVDVVAAILRDRPITGHDIKTVANFVQNLKTRPSE
jgi:hypothetical protein